jgi:hypothetical protein
MAALEAGPANPIRSCGPAGEALIAVDRASPENQNLGDLVSWVRR